MYAWADVVVYRSGRVHVAVHGFDEGFGPTRIIDEFEITASNSRWPVARNTTKEQYEL